jgi:hypothetical protein
MNDKTKLEVDIEREEAKRPYSLSVLIVILVVTIGILGVYTFNLRKELSDKEQELTLMKQKYGKEKSKLLNIISGIKKGQEVIKEQSPSLPDESKQNLQKTETKN